MLLLNHRHLHKAADLLAKWYGSNIIGLYFGHTPAIILTDTEKVKTALFHPDFDGKPDILLGRLREPNMNLRGKCLLMASTDNFTDLIGETNSVQVSSSPRVLCGTRRDVSRCAI